MPGNAAPIDVRQTLQSVAFPSAMIGRDGRFTWVNDAFAEHFGAARGARLTSVVAPDHRDRARMRFSRQLLGQEGDTDNVVLLGKDGERIPVEISTVPLRGPDDDVPWGVFGVGHVQDGDKRLLSPPDAPHLTPRQAEVLRHLGTGRSTQQISEQLGVTLETARGYIKRVLQKLGAHSRLEAVALARAAGLLE